MCARVAGGPSLPLCDCRSLGQRLWLFTGRCPGRACLTESLHPPVFHASPRLGPPKSLRTPGVHEITCFVISSSSLQLQILSTPRSHLTRWQSEGPFWEPEMTQRSMRDDSAVKSYCSFRGSQFTFPPSHLGITTRGSHSLLVSMGSCTRRNT